MQKRIATPVFLGVLKMFGRLPASLAILGIAALGEFNDRSIADEAVAAGRLAIHSTVCDSTIGHRIDGRPIAAAVHTDSITLRSIAARSVADTTLARRAGIGQSIIRVTITERTIFAIA